MDRKFRIASAGLLILAAGGFVLLSRTGTSGKRPSFHDILVNHPPDYVSLVNPGDPAVRALAARLGTPEAAYAFVRDRIRYVPMTATGPPGDAIRAEAASCLGKAALLCSLYRAMGIPATAVRVITGDVVIQGSLADHAWIDLEYKGSCFQQDPSGFLGVFGFAQFPGTEFTRSFVHEEDFCFNDDGFAVVSQMNRFRGGM